MIAKRLYKRVPLTGTATLKFQNKDEIQSIQAMTGNISFGGVGLYADDLIEIDTHVSITIIFISINGIKTESIEGRVIYNKKIGGIYFLGIYFDEEINPENQPSLYEHIQKILTWDK